MPSTHALEVLALGRTYINLEGEQIGSSLKDMLSFKKNVSGTSTLVSIGLSRLGRACALLSKIGQDPLGEHIKEVLAAENIDPTLIITDPHHATLLALNNDSFFEHHSLLPLQESDIDPGMIGHAKALFLTSEMFASEENNRAARKAIVAAKDNQTRIILALEMWPALTKSAPQGQTLDTVLPFCDLIIGYEEEFHRLANTQDTYLALTHLRGLTDATLVMKGRRECYAFDGAILNQWQHASHHAQFDPIHFAPLNAHAAFIAQFIHAWLKGEPPANALKQAQIAQTLAQTNPQHLGLPSEKVFSYIESKGFDNLDQIIHTPYFKHLQYVSTRTIANAQKCLVNFGYHGQWLKLAEPFATSEDRVQKAKALLAQGIFSLSHPHLQTGIVSDEMPGDELLLSILAPGATLARTLEQPNQIPLQFASQTDMTSTLLKWPKEHIAKVSVMYHPDDRYITRGEQEKALIALYQACRETEHPLLVEIAPPTNSLITASTLGHIMQRFYDIGVYPDWWQFSSPRDQRSWDSVHRVIQDNDPDCLGIFIHTPLTAIDQLSIMLDTAAKQPLCKGVVLSRNLFQPILEQWFAQKIADHVLIEQVKPIFQKMAALWGQKQTTAASQKVC